MEGGGDISEQLFDTLFSALPLSFRIMYFYNLSSFS